MKLLIFPFLFVSFLSFGQKEKPMNYRKFDQKLIHFGFMLGGNTTNFTLVRKTDIYQKYGVESLTTNSVFGGQLGVVTSLRCGTPIVRLRFLPSLSFQERTISYRFVNDSYTGNTDNVERLNSTNIDLPLMFQFRTLRLNNFAAYCLIGGMYSINLQSNENAAQDFTNPFLKTKKFDVQGQIGFGVEFFAAFFKFGMEIKYSQGFTNVFIPENTPIANPIERMYKNGWRFSIIFEG